MSAVLQAPTEQHQIPRELSVTLRVDEQINRDLIEGQGLVAAAEACIVDCADMAEVAKANLDGVIAFRKNLEARHKRFVEPAKKIIDEANELFRPAIKAAEQAEAIYRKRLGEFQLAEQRRIEELRRKQQEEERRAREEAEREAAAARRRAEEAARKAREEAALAEAERRRQEEEARRAREAGDRRAAAEAERKAQALAAEQARKEEEERQRLEAAAREEERIRMEAAARQSTTVVPEAAKISGLSMRDNWVAELDSENYPSPTAAKFALVKAIAAGREDLLALVIVDTSAASKLAKALKDNFNVPGLKAVNRPVPVNRKS